METWTQDQVKQLRKLYSNTSNAAIATEIGKGVEAVKKKAERMGLRKSKSYLKKLGRS